jgi:hypothetical protein
MVQRSEAKESGCWKKRRTLRRLRIAENLVIKISNSREKKFHWNAVFRFRLASRKVAGTVSSLSAQSEPALCLSFTEMIRESHREVYGRDGGFAFLFLCWFSRRGEVRTMTKKMNLCIAFTLGVLGVLLQFSLCAQGQQTLGGITGTVTDPSGSVLPETTITIVADQTKLTRIQKTTANGAYDFVNLPIGTYTVTVTHDGFQTEKFPAIPVQADRTATLNVTLKVGQVGTTVEVQAAPLMNAVDTTNGYVLEEQQIQSVPLPTGSFTQLAILSPGVSAELNGGTGVNTGLGNQPIWANGQRDTSNTFLVNGVDASNLFNGKSTSQVASARIVNNTGVANAASTSAAPLPVLQPLVFTTAPLDWAW